MTTAEALYGAYQTARTSVLDRARTASDLTIPGLIPHDGNDIHGSHTQPFQSVGAALVGNLSASLLLALFPPNLPFFRLNMDEVTAEEMGAELGEANARLAVLGRTVYSLMESASLRPLLMEVIRHLVVAGNVLLYIPADGEPPKFYRLDQYVVKRDGYGRFLDIVVREQVYPSTLSPEVRAACGVDYKEGDSEQLVDLFTMVQRRNKKVTHWQELRGKEVPGSRGESPEESSGWIPLRWLVVPGSDYGRSHVTEYIGDLTTLEDLSKSMVQFAMVAARIIHIVDPNAGVDVDELATAETGDFLTGYRDRISTMQLDKSQDWAVVNTLAERIEQRLSAAFLVRSGVMRDAERVTAEEVRIVAQELENTLGGTYTVLSAELQLPLTRRYLYMGARAGKVPKLPKEIQPRIITGFDALGRAHSVNRIRAWLQGLQETVGPAVIQQIINVTELARRLGEGEGVDGLEDLLKSPEQQAQEQQAAAQSQVGAAVAPEIVKQGLAGMAAEPEQPQ
ncbi:head to tail connecting protein [Mycobacterium phage jiawei]|nr:head to tail connecting protein [Mycobacterium phage jiawei]